MRNEPAAFGKYVKLFESGAFVGIVELVDTDGATVDVRTTKGELLTVGRSDIAEMTAEEEAEFLRTVKIDSTRAGPSSQAE
jgi:hypothetical protein